MSSKQPVEQFDFCTNANFLAQMYYESLETFQLYVIEHGALGDGTFHFLTFEQIIDVK